MLSSSSTPANKRQLLSVFASKRPYSRFGGDEYSPAINHYEPMSYSQEVTLKLTIKGTLNGLKTIINARDLNKLLDTAEGRATLLDKGRFEMREVSHARTMDASPDATFID